MTIAGCRCKRWWCAIAAAAALVAACDASAQVDSLRTPGRTTDVISMGQVDSTFRTAFLSMNRTVNTFLWTVNGAAAGSTVG